MTLLETIKHFFAVDNVVFILGVNLSELENSVKARYGAGIDAGKYLQKFIHIRYELPPQIGAHEKAQAWEVYFNMAANKLSLSDFFTSRLKRYLKALPESSGISLREVQRLLTIVALIPTSGNSGLSEKMYWGWRAVISGLVTLKCFYPDLYKKARNGTLSYSDLEKTFSFLDSDNSNFDQYEQRVWAEIFNEPWDKENFGSGQGPFGAFGLRGVGDFVQKIAEDYLETFEILDAR